MTEQTENQQEDKGGDPNLSTPPTMEERAKELGWRPFEEYEGDPEKWVSAEIYVARTPLFEKIESQGRRMKELAKVIDDLMSHNKKIEETQYKRALETLRQERRVAREAGDHDRVDQLEEQIDEIKDAQKTATETKQSVSEPQELVSWKENNSWYGTNEMMTDWADGRGVKLHKQGKSPAEVLDTLTREAKEKFPMAFSNPKRTQPNAVENSSSSGKAPAKKATQYNPSDEERRIARRFVKEGLFKTEDEYYAELAKVA